MKRNRRFGLVVSVLLAGIGLAAHAVQAQTLQQEPQTEPQVRPQTRPRVHPFDACASAAADRTVTFGASATVLSITSPNTSYSNDGCTRYVLDINVGQAEPVEHFATNFRLQADVANPPTGAECEGTEVNVTYYKKASGQSSFTRIGGGRRTGHWIGVNGGPLHGTCAVWGEADPDSRQTNLSNLGYPTAGTDVYRVAIDAKVNGAFRTVTVGVSRNQLQP